MILAPVLARVVTSTPRGQAMLFVLAIAACSRPDTTAPEPPSRCTSPPPASVALGDWLRAECYGAWPSDPAVRASSMNPSGIRVFLSPSLADSVAGGNAAHPVGAAAVREIFSPDHRERVGWSVSVKTSDGWFWYEEFDRLGHATVSGRDAPGCTSCHEAGQDLVQTRRLAGR
ncbi:MAG: hypothetical protein IV100_16070 [Myxococcales bacterium]|nr:hypothetical protein [Myxococcales bacterium]